MEDYRWLASANYLKAVAGPAHALVLGDRYAVMSERSRCGHERQQPLHSRHRPSRFGRQQLFDSRLPLIYQTRSARHLHASCGVF